MAFREVLVTQVYEVLRAWLGGQGKRPAAARAGVDVKTAQRYIAAAREAGLDRGGDESQLTDELIGLVVAAVRPARPQGHGAAWESLIPVTSDISGWVKDDVTLVKIGELLERRGIMVPYRTLARFAAERCGFTGSRPRVTVRVDDPPPGRELQVDFGYLGMIADGERRRKLHALVFTAVMSRYCYVFLSFSQTTVAVIAGCEAAWEFFGGMFPVLIPDNLKPVVDAADRTEPRWNREWLEYMQVRGLQVDPARVRSPQDKGRVEAGVKFVQRSFFAGEDFTAGIQDAQLRADDWCRVRAGMRVHGTTRQHPAEVFAQAEAPLLLPAPEQPYRVPAWSEAKVQRDFHVRAQNAFYSVPYKLAGQQVSVRADGTLVKIYHRSAVIRTHPQQPPGGRSTETSDYPPGTDVYARRDVDKLANRAAARGEAIGIYASRVLDIPLPWSKMRSVYMLIGLCDKYGNDTVEQACAAALGLDVISVAKIKSIVEKGTGRQAEQAAARERQASQAARKVTAARFARDPREFATATGVRMQVLPGGNDPGAAAAAGDGA